MKGVQEFLNSGFFTWRLWFISWARSWFSLTFPFGLGFLWRLFLLLDWGLSLYFFRRKGLFEFFLLGLFLLKRRNFLWLFLLILLLVHKVLKFLQTVYPYKSFIVVLDGFFGLVEFYIVVNEEIYELVFRHWSFEELLLLRRHFLYIKLKF